MRYAPILVLSVFAAGCTSIVSDSLDSAPEWFKERKTELEGEGYPTFEQAAKMQQEVELAPWNEIQRDLQLVMRDMQRSAPEPVKMTAADMRAWADEQKALIAKGEEPY